MKSSKNVFSGLNSLLFPDRTVLPDLFGKSKLFNPEKTLFAISENQGKIVYMSIGRFCPSDGSAGH